MYPAGTVHHVQNGRMTDSGLAADLFLSRYGSLSPAFGVVISQSSANFIAQAIQLGLRVYGVSPLAVRVAQSPQETLERLWYAAAVNGKQRWHLITPADISSYLLTDAVFRNDMPAAVSELKQHPTSVVLNALPHLDQELFCRLLAAVIDVRLFEHSVHPSRLSRLFCYLGLTAGNMNALIHGMEGPDLNADRAQLATAWLGESPRLLWGRQRCCDFLHRDCFQAESPAIGMLKASRRFIRFVRYTWMAGPGQKFLPSRFFRDSADFDSFCDARQAIEAVPDVSS